MTDTKKITSWFFAILMCSLTSGAAPVYAEFSASVDRTVIAPHDTFELTLRSDYSTSASPNMSPLNKDFDVLGTRQSQQIRIINGNRESWRDWTLTLSPKQTGSLTIPPITMGQEQSSAISINVQNNSSFSPGSTQEKSPLFIRTELDQNQVYTQQQLALTLRIFHSVNLYDDSRLSPLEVEDAIVNQIGETQKYETVVDGVRYGIFELKFVISPQKSGTLLIPSLTFSATAATRRDHFASIFSNSGQSVVARSQEMKITVLDPPADYTGQTWLPAKNLTIRESWSQPIDSIQVGDAVTRTVTMEAEGLNAAQLPPIDMPSPTGVNTYPDQSTTSDTAAASGVTGKRTSAVAMVPTEAGSINLPPIRVTWFDVVNKKTRIAEIPAASLTVLPSAASTTKGAELEQPSTASSAVAEEKSTDVTEKDDKEKTESDNPSAIWKWIASGLAGLWLLTGLLLLFFWKKRKKKQAETTMEPTEKKTSTTPHTPTDEPSAFKALKNACVNEDKPEMILEQMKQWCRLFLDDPSIKTAQQCAERLQSEQLAELCSEIDAGIYSGESRQTTGEEMLSVCSAIRKTFSVEADSNLSALYPE